MYVCAFVGTYEHVPVPSEARREWDLLELEL